MKKIGYHSDDVSPRPLNGYPKMRHNSAFTGQKRLEFWNQKGKQIFSWQAKNFGPYTNIFGPRPFIVESLEENLAFLPQAPTKYG